LGGSLEAVGAVLPGIAVLGFALKGLADTAKRAKYNKELAAAMLSKVDMIAKNILPTLVPNLQKAAKTKEDKKHVMEAIQPVIDQVAECRQICEDMCKEGFMKAMFKCSNNKHMLATLMRTLDEKLDALSMKVSERQLNLSLEMDSKLDKITMMMEQMQVIDHD
jgi:mevalonate kinase